jgi:hypothetical protein
MTTMTPDEAWRIALEELAKAYRTAPTPDGVRGAEYATMVAYKLVTDAERFARSF